VNYDVKLFGSVLDSIKNNEQIKTQKTSVDKVAWEVNQHLAPGTLINLPSRSLKSLYIKVVMRYLQAQNSAQDVATINNKAGELQNKPIGGTWI